LEFFKEEIRNESAAIKIDAVNRLNLIASALGPARTVSELIPYVTQVVQEEPLCNDEEFLFSMARQYSVLSQYMDGHDELLIAPLEHLAAQEETVIRDQAIQSLCSVVEKKPSLAPEYLVPTFHRLATETDFFTARVSACSLLPTAYRFANEDQKAGLRKAYQTLLYDDTPMVRRAAAQKMRDLISVCDKQDLLLADMLTVYKQLSQEDTQDTIRVACVHTTLVMAKMFNPDENRQHTISVIKDAAEDRSWRVRLTVAKNFDALCQAYGPEIVDSHLMQPFIQLLQDGEQEVRKEAVRVIEPCLQLPHPFTQEQLQQQILPQFQALGLDSAQPVRAALAQVLGPVAKTVGHDVTQQKLLSLISELMKDEFHDVRLNIVSHAGLICEVLTVDGMVNSLLHTIQNLMLDNHWRIRQSVVEQVPKLARLFGVEMFQSKLEALFLSSMRDSVHSVRQAAIKTLREIADAFGAAWTADHLFPKLAEQYQSSAGYACRVTCLNVMSQVSCVISQQQVEELVLPFVIKATKDSVHNVRFCACRTIMWLTEHRCLSARSVATWRPALQDLETDSDIDVQYYAQRALATCDNL